MTSKERVLRVIDHKTSDRVAVTFDAEKEVYDLLYGHLKINTKEALFDKLNVDTWMILPKNFLFKVQDKDKDEKTSVWGYKTIVSQYSGGFYDELSYCPLAGKDNISDIQNHSWPDIMDFDVEHYSDEAEEHKNRAVIGIFTWGAYFISTYVRGMENLLGDFALSKKYAKTLINKIADISHEFLSYILEKHGDGIDIIYMADDYCSQQGPLFSPAIFKEYIFPYLKRVVDLTHKHNKKFLLHCCGSVREFLPMIIEADVDILEPIQIRAKGMEPKALKNDFGKDICFYGGFDLQEKLCRSSVKEVEDEAKRLIDIFNKDGGYIFGPGHTYIQTDAPLENILTMYKTASAL